MKISLDWLRDFVEIPRSLTAEDLGEKLTLHTAEVEGVIDEAKTYEKMLVGKVLALKKHPNADRLFLVKTAIGRKEPIQIVCGGQNLKVGMLVAVALPGASTHLHGRELVELAEVNIRGEKSFGMICAGEEIGLPADNTPASTTVRIHDLSKLKAKPGTPLAKALEKEDHIFDIDNKSLTHRPDLWSHYGFARELSVILKKPLKKLDTLLKTKGVQGKENVNIRIENRLLCPRFSACILKGICVEESPEWLKARLEAAGMNPHNNIVDITNYVMLELGQPLHAYDRKQVGDDGFFIRFARNGERLTTLDETELTLNSKDPLVCNASGEPLGIAGIKGGLKSGINDKTNEIILEAVNFDPVVIRKSSLRLGLRTEASQRFEKSLDPSMTEVALKRAIHLIEKLCSTASQVSPIVTRGSWKAEKIQIRVNPATICKKIGVKISDQEISKILKSLSFGVEKNRKDFVITVPSHRATRDITIEEDIVEEVVRIYGYDRIPAKRPQQVLALPIENEERWYKHVVRNIFALGLGFTEVLNYSFYSEDRFRRCSLSEEGHLKILNYLSEDQTHLRVSLIPNLLATVATNSRNFASFKIFELGRTYKESGKFMPLEEKVLAAAVMKEGEPFPYIKGALEDFCRTFRPGKMAFVPSQKSPPYAHPKKCVDVLLQGKVIGQAFTVHPETLKAFDIAKQVACFELKFSELVKDGREIPRFKPLPKFPSITFDVSVLVDRKTPVSELETLIRANDPQNLIRHVELFDIYEGKNLPENKKSLSFSIELRHDERTLTDKEFKDLQGRLFLDLERFGAKIRGK